MLSTMTDDGTTNTCSTLINSRPDLVVKTATIIIMNSPVESNKRTAEAAASLNDDDTPRM
jgi:hypothetical protein